MRMIFLAIAATTSVTNAFACPVSDALAKRYGISFSGFDTPIPAAAQEPAGSGGSRLVRLPLPSAYLVSDGFQHTVVLDTAAKKAWILRTGGFAGVREWYGPVDAGDATLEGCRIEPELAADTARKN